MNRTLPILATTALLFSLGCRSIPSSVVTSTESLRSASRQMGSTHSAAVKLYHDRVVKINDLMQSSCKTELDAHERDVRILSERLHELNNAYTVLAAAMEEVLHADPATPRSAMFDREQAVDLAIMMVYERERAHAAQADLSATLSTLNPTSGKSSSFDYDRSLLTQTHNSLVLENDRTLEAVENRVFTDFDRLDNGFDDLLAYMYAHVKRKAERKRTRNESLRTTDELERRAREAGYFRKSSMFDSLDEALHGIK